MILNIKFNVSILLFKSMLVLKRYIIYFILLMETDILLCLFLCQKEKEQMIWKLFIKNLSVWRMLQFVYIRFLTLFNTDMNKSFISNTCISNWCLLCISECLPLEECPDTSTEMASAAEQPGMIAIVNRSGCCPRVDVVCKPETCPMPPTCREPFYEPVARDVERCCPQYRCGIHKLF